MLVTGGAGFIGSHIVDALVQQGHKVVVVDDLSTGFAQNLNPHARFYEMSICNPQLAEVFEQEKLEVLNHQAAQMVIQRSVEDPIFDAEQNILGSLNLILNCIRFEVKKIIYASSGGAVYGEPEYLPVDERHPVNPISQYGVSKHTVEHYLHLYCVQYGLDYVVLRYSNVYGPRQNPEGEAGVVAIFARHMLRGESPTIFGPGDKTRDYTYVADVAMANLLAMQRDGKGIYNIGTGVETSDMKMFDTLAEILGYQGAPHCGQVRKGEIYRICLNSSKASRELGWQPQVSLKEGLLQTVGYYKAHSILSGSKPPEGVPFKQRNKRLRG